VRGVPAPSPERKGPRWGWVSPADGIVLSVDEWTQIRALDRIERRLPLKTPGPDGWRAIANGAQPPSCSSLSTGPKQGHWRLHAGNGDQEFNCLLKLQDTSVARLDLIHADHGAYKPPNSAVRTSLSQLEVREPSG
jgi:hypothetical protein